MINWVLHAISLLAIIFLLVKRNSECCAPGPNGKASTTDSTMTNSSPGFPVAFFYSDSLLNNLGFVKENEKTMKKKQDAIVNELNPKRHLLGRYFPLELTKIHIYIFDLD